MIPGLDNYVSIKPDTHQYFDREGNEYMSASKFIGLFYKKFDANLIAGIVANSDGLSKQQVLDKWSDQTNNGTRIHNALEEYDKTLQISPENESIKEGIINIASQYKDYYRTYNEQILYDRENFIAGTTDKALVTTSHKNSVIDISDFKTYNKGINQKEVDKYGKPKNEYMLHCLSHLQNSSYNKVALQLSLYAYMLQKQTGRKIGKLFAHWINPNNPLINFQIPVPYMKHEIIAMIKHKNENPIILPKSVIDEFGFDEIAH